MDFNDWKDFLPTSVVENLLGPSSDAIGKTLGGILYWTFQLPIKYGIVKKAEFDQLAQETSKKLKKIPEENKSADKLGLVLKALEESKYQLNEEELRKMFAQLIASTLDNRKNTVISPRFATILSQLSGKDAEFFKLLVEENHGDLLYGYLIGRKEEYGAYQTITDKMYEQNRTSIRSLPISSVNVLESLGLVKDFETSYPSNNIADATYQHIEKSLHSLNSKFHNPFQDCSNDIIEFKHCHVELTSFGANFSRCVL